MTDQTQAVTETPKAVTTEAPIETSQVKAPEAGAQDDLDTLLKEYDDQVKNAPKEPDTPPAEPDKKQAWLEAQVRALSEDKTKQRIETSLSKAVDEAKKLDGLKEVDSDVLRDLVFAQANKDARFAHAVLNGDAKAIRAYARSIEGKFSSMPDKKLTEDRRAAADAVRGASLQPPPQQPPDLGKMTDAEFNAYERSLPK